MKPAERKDDHVPIVMQTQPDPKRYVIARAKKEDKEKESTDIVPSSKTKTLASALRQRRVGQSNSTSKGKTRPRTDAHEDNRGRHWRLAQYRVHSDSDTIALIRRPHRAYLWELSARVRLLLLCVKAALVMTGSLLCRIRMGRLSFLCCLPLS